MRMKEKQVPASQLSGLFMFGIDNIAWIDIATLYALCHGKENHFETP